MAVSSTWLVALMLCRAVAVMTSDVSSESESIADEKESSTDGVRCYCNSAECVGTSYMCRAPPGGGCYSELSTRARAHDARYGCLQTTHSSEDPVRQCHNSPSKESGEGAPAQVSMHRQQTLMLCCFQDLCNHEDSPLARRRLNLTTQVVHPEGGEGRAGYGSSEVWFKAATIAVPVCGAVIMFLLVGVAVRLLKADAADIKLRAPYITHGLPPPTHPEVKKALGQGACAAPLLVTPGGCLVHVERAELTSVQLYPDCDIQR